ncbi:hypothetical protein A3C23_04445 [Candidatus Roizmanbacteria bacterium RIFCSPHIGHO2_02_FULL_37_13b]|uniref:FAD-binding FR-type domain-containing protein n=1 Tax=Candidatus Roizmanbacteria bacterium RIFCSPLOWO2_02_FULL_36_11 TaxID=1802071 RepID=A0A1F7JH65_9BACT|nr:MAG: hypothetical protein A3C23_04445 [Candidatus Roizmanbacteria bacterium RIFCSPHIGHO2_02_FULL_37_13b]OGK54957.1 MAG: hypothetical protein A3H78_00590 [Candidatus Roizmanbacteria bacterium RIFCSPLOWO2_02_FULL_36_11]
MVQKYFTQLVKKTQLTETVWFLKFSLINPSVLDFVAGQFMVLKPNENTSRSYSILNPDFKKDYVDFVVHLVPDGIASNYFRDLKEGDRVEFMGPAGVFTLRDTTREKIFLATGTGVAPIWSMLASHYKKIKDNIHPDDSKFTIFWGIEYKRDTYLVNWFDDLASQWQNLNYRVCLSRETDFSDLPPYYLSGRVNSNLIEFLHGDKERLVVDAEKAKQFDYYICGGREVVESLRQFVAGLGVPKEQIYFERF